MRSLVLIIAIVIPSLAYSQQTPAFLNASEHWADSVLSTLTPDERIGQLFMVAAYSNREKDHEDEILALIKNQKIGGVIFFQGGPVRQAQLTNKYQRASKVPLMISMDGEWGLGMRLDSAISFPYQMALGAIQDNSLIYEMGQEIGRQFKELGVHVNFAPVIDVNNNPKNPVINFRSFGSDKTNVANKGLAYMHGMQDAGILATGKHFPGHGDTDVDSHKDLPVIEHNQERLTDIELYPFKKLFEEGLGSVMVAHLNIPSLDPSENSISTLSKPIVTELLQNKMKFKGLVFTDALNMKGVAKHFKPGILDAKALIAGNDALLLSEGVPAAIAAIKLAIRNKEISMIEIDNRCKKMLLAKAWLGLNRKQEVDHEGIIAKLNTTEAKLLNRRLVEESITVLINDDEQLPIRDLGSTSIAALVIGKYSQNAFQTTLAKYADVTQYFLHKDSAEANGGRMLEMLKNYDLVILGMQDMSQYASRNFGLGNGVVDFVDELVQKNSTSLALMGNPYSLELFSHIEKAQSLIIAYQDNQDTQDITAQIIFGGIGAKGKLPVSVNPTFQFSDGIDTQGGIRFKYTLPEEVGMDGDYLNHKIDSIATSAIALGVAPGIQVLVAKDGKVVKHETYGYHTYGNDRKVQKTDLYDFASLTKITGALPALMKLHDQGQFDLEESLGTYLPYFDRGNKKDISLRSILAHNAQLKAWIPYWTTTFNKKGRFKSKTLSYDQNDDYGIVLKDGLYLHNDYKSKIYKMIRKSRLNEKPGYVYSGLSFYIFPELVSTLTGTDFETHLKNTFYQPLGATSITYNPSRFFDLAQIIPTENDTFFRKMQIHGVVHDEGAAMMGGISSNAGLFGSATDLAKLMQMYLWYGSYGGDRFISEATMRKFTACQYCEQGNRRGLAFDKPVLENKQNGSTAIEASELSFGHSGYTGTFTWADPANGTLFIFMSNRVYPTRNNSKIYQYNVRPAMHQAIYNALKKE